MVRLQLAGQFIGERDMGINLIEQGIPGLRFTEVDPLLPEIPAKPERTWELDTIQTPFVMQILWQWEGHEQLIVTDDHVFLSENTVERGNGQKASLIVPVVRSQLKPFQLALAGSGLRLFAYGSTDDEHARRFEILRSGEIPPDMKEDHPLLGQVNIDTGEITEL